MRRCCLWSLVLGGVAVLSSGCGAGLVTSLANGGDGTQPTPTLRVRPSSVPLVPAPNTLRTIEISNARIPADASLAVLLTAELPPPPSPEPPQDPEMVDVLQKSVVVADQGEAIRFVLDTAAIVERIGDDAAVEADVKAYLTVFVNGEQLGERMLLSLVRQPTAALVLEDKETEQFLSPLGGQVRIRVPGLLSSNADDVQVVVQVPDPERPVGSPATITRVCTETQIQLDGVPQVTCFAPGNGFPTQATIVVRDELAGESTEVTNVFYSPAIVAAQPAQGSTRGGMPVSLSGVALLPHDFSGGSPAPYAFDDVRLFFRRDGREVELPREEFRFDASTPNQLTFTMPGSPDGRPGPVEIELRVRLGEVEAKAWSRSQFQFANPDPVFGPRGAVLDQLPVAVAPIRLDDDPERAPDLVALINQDGVGYLQLLLSEQNGMFQRFGAPRQVGSPDVGAERNPRDLCVGDFDGDGVADVFVANAGASLAVHHLVLGQSRPAPPLAAQPYRTTAAAGMVRCRAADFNRDGRSDVVLLPGPDAAPGVRPVVLFARAPRAGEVRWRPDESPFADPVVLGVRDFSFDAIEVADLDGDQQLDVAVVSGRLGRLDVVYGLPDGAFSPRVSLDFDVPGYDERPDSPAVGLHACQDRSWSSLALVLAGVFGSGFTRPTVAVLRQTALRTFAPPDGDQTASFSVDPAGLSLAADLDGTAPVELVIGARDVGQFYSLAFLRLGKSSYGPFTSVERGAESPRNIRAMTFGQALQQSPTSTSGLRDAVFVMHEIELGEGPREKRLSTRLVPPPELIEQLGLLPPDAGSPHALSAIHAVLIGKFRSGSDAPALAVLRTDAAGQNLALINDDNSSLSLLPSPGASRSAPNLVPRSAHVLPAPAGRADVIVALDRSSRLVYWPSAELLPTLGPELRLLLSDPQLQALPLADSSRMLVGDVDGDGLADLIALLSFALPPSGAIQPGEGKAAVVLMRGCSECEGLPFHSPTVTMVHSESAGIALGDFAARPDPDPQPGTPRRLELAIAVPRGVTAEGIDGNHIRFYRFEPGGAPEGDRFVPAAAPEGPPWLLAGSEPTELGAADVDRDGKVDLLVACAGDSELWLLRNTAPRGPHLHVRVTSFVEAARLEVTPGRPTHLLLNDINGDGNQDAVVVTEEPGATSIAMFVNNGVGGFATKSEVPTTRIGNQAAHWAVNLGDWNGDGLPDLLLGGDRVPFDLTDYNLRILFGGTR